MRPAVATLAVVVLTFSASAQSRSAPETDLVRLVQNLKASSFDASLPKVNLGFFLNYEAAGARVDWKVTDCGAWPASKELDRSPHPLKCVEADFDANDIAVTMLVDVAHAQQPPPRILVVYVAIVDREGKSRSIRLRDLPKELHRPVPRSPRDVPNIVAVTEPSTSSE
jgi:hypothetical protein